MIGIAVGISRLDFENPILTLQTGLARLKVRRAALAAVTLGAAPLLWGPLMVVLLAVARIDPVRALGVPYIAANFAFGAFVAGVALVVARVFGDRLRKAPWMAGAIHALSGEAYREAADYLDSIERYREG